MSHKINTPVLRDLLAIIDAPAYYFDKAEAADRWADLARALAAAIGPVAETDHVVVLSQQDELTVRSALDDAWTYRLGEADHAQDEDLEPFDRLALEKLGELSNPTNDPFPAQGDGDRPYGIPLDQY